MGESRNQRAGLLPTSLSTDDDSIGGTIFGIAFLLGVLALLVLAPFFNSVVDDAGEPISIIAPALWPAWAPVIIAAVALSIIFALVTAFRGWTLGLAIANVVVIGAGFALLVWWATHDLLLNPAFFEAIGWGAQAAGGITLGIMGLAIVNAVIEISGGFVKARRRAAAS